MASTSSPAAATGHLFFDLDGTLSDPRQGIFSCFQQALRSLGRGQVAKSELTQFIGPPLEECFGRLLATNDTELIERAVTAFRSCYGGGALFDNVLYPGIFPLLHELTRRGWHLYLVTAKKEEYARRILHHFGIDLFFRDCLGARPGRPGRKETMIAELMASHGLPGRATFMVGDRSQDMEGARANDIKGYGVLWGFGSREELVTAGAVRLFASPDELARFLGDRSLGCPERPGRPSQSD